MHFMEDAGTVTVRYRWFGASSISLLVFSLAWNTFLGVFAYLMISKGTPEQIFQFVFFSLLFVAIGLASLYAAIAYLRNSTEICITGEEISLRHGPVYWGKPIVFDPAMVAAVHVRERVFWKNQAKKRYVYKLFLQTTDEKEHLFLRLEERPTARRLGEILARYTGVPLTS